MLVFYHDDLQIEILDIFRIDRQKSKYHTPKRPFHILTKRISGYSDMIFENSSLIATPENLLYIPANLEYSRQSYDDEEIIAIHFNILNHDFFKPRLLEVDREKCDEAFKKIYSLWSEGKRGCKYKCTAALYDYLGDIIVEKSPSTELSKIKASVDYIKNNPERKIQLDELCKMSGLCQTQFRKLFKLEFGASPIKYINRLRISRAISMMSSDYYSMAEIAEQCGFSEQKYFNKVFKSEIGLSPSQYKKELLFELGQNQRS